MDESSISPKEIGRLRQRLGETAQAFGRRFGRTPQTVYAWEAGKRCPDKLVVRMMRDLERERGRA